MKIDGSCHCGRLTYRAEVDPSQVFACHCTDCQTISGSPFRWAISVNDKDFTLLSGTPKTYIKLGESGRESHQLFCPDCASPLYSAPGGDGPKVLRLRLGTCRQRQELAPTFEFWNQSSQDWLSLNSKTKKFDKQP